MAGLVFRLPLGILLSLLLTVGTKAQQGIPVPERQLTPNHAASMPVVKLHVMRFKLLNGTTGWASTGDKLLLTTDAGTSWKDITPPIRSIEPFADVLFLNPMAGWVLYRSDSDDADFIVATTVNGGDSWTTSKVKIALPPPENGGPELGSNGQLAFIDRLNGYLFFDYQTGSAFSWAGMYTTTDGGNTWHESNMNPGYFGEIRAFPNGDVWAVDGYGMQLAVSRGRHDFEEVSLPEPASVAPAAGPRYSLPEFVDPVHGYLAVTYEGGPGARSAAALFETTDGGHNWTTSRTISHLVEEEIIPTVIADSTWTLPFSTANHPSQPSVIKIRPNDHVAAPSHIHGGVFNRCELSFASHSQGWANCGGELSSTTDGGDSWKSISPRARNGVMTQDPVTPTRSIPVVPKNATHFSR